MDRDRIIIAVTELNKELWTSIYKFIKSIIFEMDNVSKIESYQNLKKKAKGVRLKTNVSPDMAPDVFSLYGETIYDIHRLSKETCFSIIYKKNDDREDFAELVPFTLLQHEFGQNISLGIDICNLNDPKSYYFKCSDFFFLHDNVKLKLGKQSIYFIQRTVNEMTGVIELGTKQLAGKCKDSDYIGNASRRFLPLIHVTGDNYASLFSEKGNIDSKESSFVKEGIKKIRKKFEEIKHKETKDELKRIFEFGSLFGQWFEAAYFYSYDQDELKNLNNNRIARLRDTLQIYKDSIQELVQNIIVHGGKNGVFYCVFDKKINISDSYGEVIPHFHSYDSENRFLRIGIYDFSENTRWRN